MGDDSGWRMVSNEVQGYSGPTVPQERLDALSGRTLPGPKSKPKVVNFPRHGSAVR